MSITRTFCLQFAIVILVQQRIFVCAADCNCRCNQQHICDEIVRLTIADDAQNGHWDTWNAFFPYIEQLYNKFDIQSWTEEILSLQNKIKSIDVLEERLDEAETRATRLENALKNSRKKFENKMAAFEQKLQDVQSQAMKLERNVDETEKKIKVQEELLLNISATVSKAELKYEELKEDFKLFYAEGYLKLSIEEEKESRKRSEETMKDISSRMSVLESALNEEIKAREELKRKFDELQRNYETFASREDKSRRRRALERHLTQVRKHPSTVEDKATPLE